tara:strand:+ start:563 stop:772 length:210 start_codon:yes stop_codon:yes gene_type:complete
MEVWEMEINFGFGFAGLCLALAWYYVQKLKSDHPLDVLERLVRLKDQGLIDDDEFNKIKPKLLRRLRSG